MAKKKGKRKGFQSSKHMRGKEKVKNPRWRAEVLNGKDELPIALDMEEFLSWREAMNYAEGTLHRMRGDLRSFLLWSSERGIEESKDVTKLILESYQRYLSRYKKENGKPLGISTQINRIDTIKHFFSRLCKTNRLDANPASDLERPRKPQRVLPKALTEQEIKNILNIPDITDPLGIRDRCLLTLLYSAGLRRNEACRLRIDEIDREKEVIFVNQGKGGKDRYVPLGRDALYWYERYLEEGRSKLVLNDSIMEVFISSYGEGMSHGSMGNRVKNIMKEAGIDKNGMGSHSFRHSCGSHLLAGGADLRYIQLILGHASPETTALYTHTSIEELCEVHRKAHPLG